MLDGGRYDRGGGWGKAFGLMEGCWIYGPWRGGWRREISLGDETKKKKKKSLLPTFSRVYECERVSEVSLSTKKLRLLL